MRHITIISKNKIERFREKSFPLQVSFEGESVLIGIIRFSGYVRLKNTKWKKIIQNDTVGWNWNSESVFSYPYINCTKK